MHFASKTSKSFSVTNPTENVFGNDSTITTVSAMQKEQGEIANICPTMQTEQPQMKPDSTKEHKNLEWLRASC